MVVRRSADGSSHPTAPTLVWIHGLGEQSASFDPVVVHSALARFDHVLVDLPGYGRSPWPAASHSLDELATRIAAWLDSTTEEAHAASPILVGHSMGGVLATLVAERRSVGGIVNVDGNLSRGDCTFSSQALPFTVEEFATSGFAAMRARVYEAGVTELPLRGYHAAMCMTSPAQFHRNAVELVALSETETLAARFAALGCPRLYVAGVPRGICERSRALLVEQLGPADATDRADESRGTVGAPRWLGLEPAGHWVFLDQLDRFATAVAAFARAVAASTARA